MTIQIRKASEWFGREEIRQNQTANDILNLVQEFKESIIIEEGREDIDYLITIYDDYIE